jgi:tetratricopeptide (TPR) repeat protein
MMKPKAPPLLPSLPKAPIQASPSIAGVQTAAARIKAAEAAIEADPLDVAAWDRRITEAMREGNPAPIFERVVEQFPCAARFWMAFAEWSEAQDTPQALAVYSRCLNQIPSLELWSAYLLCCKRFVSLEETFRAYQRCIDLLGTDANAGAIWAEYFALLKKAYNLAQKKKDPEAEVSGKLLAEDASPIEAARRTMKTSAMLRHRAEVSAAIDVSDEEFLRVAEALPIDVNKLRTAFQRGTVTAHSALDKLWVGYEQFEKSLGNPALAQKLLGEYMPRYIKAKAAYKDFQNLTTGIETLAVAVPVTLHNAKQQGKNLDKWRSLLHFERSNPMHVPREELKARVSLVYQQSSLSCAYHAEVWYDFSSWLDLCGQKEKATACLQQAIERFLPQDLTLRLLVAHRHELTEVPPSAASLQAADDTYQKLLDDMPKPCPLSLINYLAFVRRQRGVHDFRDAFLEATMSSPHCTWEVYAFAAMTEYHVVGSTDAAAKVFRLGLERYGDHEPSLLAAYVNFLAGANDLKSARAELSQGVLNRLQAGVRDRVANRTDPMLRDSLSFLWQKWARLERYFGDAGAVRRAINFRDEEYRNLQRDQDVEEETIADTPISLGLSTSITELEEGFRFQHLVPKTARVGLALEAVASSAPPPAPPQAPAVPGLVTAKATSNAVLDPPIAKSSTAPLRDQTVTDATDEHRRLASSAPAGANSVHISRPDVSKMLAFRPALDIVGRKRPGEEKDRVRSAGLGAQADEPMQIPAAIPKCLQDMLAVLPSRSLKGAKPDVDYLLRVLQTITIPAIPIKELENFRYDSLRIAKEEDSGALRRRFAKDELEAESTTSFFSFKPSLYRDRLQAKRQKVMVEHQQTKAEIFS